MSTEPRKEPLHPDEQMFEDLLAAVGAYMLRFGEPWDFKDNVTYSLWMDYNGWPQLRLSIGNGRLELLHPDVVMDLRQIMRRFPSWSLVVPVVELDRPDWPEMGLIIRAHEVIDGLQRDYFPPEHRNYHYADSRVGTADD